MSVNLVRSQPGSSIPVDNFTMHVAWDETSSYLIKQGNVVPSRNIIQYFTGYICACRVMCMVGHLERSLDQGGGMCMWYNHKL